MAATDSRIVHIETRVDRLEADVSDIKTGVQKLLDRPVLPGFGAIVSTLVSTLMVVGMIMGFAEWRLNRATYPIEENLSELGSLQSKIDNRVWENLLKTVVLEERSKWLQLQNSWSTKTEALQ